ncbi:MULTISPECIES: pyridoxamine 5'-phosphate oxidase [unclassified Thioalkalivibrio]|uniref:pyridoxamine 5'-phosphate oxidase n=1 Tax=unclassified Thioalkalivibrio TaxID=2621013 RepID=UPI00037956BD|nr:MULTISPECIES: pyridoxamine 5'-phosphate oxidase [unclassified Thioalkalivibrio]
MTTADHRHTRRDYARAELRRSDLRDNPLGLLNDWLEAAREAGNPDPTAMILATADADGQPSARTVLLKHVDAGGLAWYTDSRSRKGQDLNENPRAALLFYWPETERQIRVEGPVSALPGELADEYFHQRPRGSQLAAAASTQSHPVVDRGELEQRVRELEGQYPDGDIPRDPAWIGYRLQPELFEFWQGRPNRLHDRFQYRRVGKDWEVTRLMP